MINNDGDDNGQVHNYLRRLTRVIETINYAAFETAIELIRAAWIDGRQVIVFGNGGSALTAEHYVTDWNKGIYMATGRPFRGVCLSENMGLVSAYANDLSYEDIFEAQLKPMMGRRDLVIGISGSGNSENVLRGIRYAKENEGVTLGVTGYDGGKLRGLATHAICAEVRDMQLSEDIHLIFGHMVMRALCGTTA